MEEIYPDGIVEWSQRLAVSPEDLRNAIARVGPEVGNVKQFLKGNHNPVQVPAGHRDTSAPPVDERER